MQEHFVIFGMGRTGSSLLQSLLNSHPQICCEGELFRLRRWRRLMRPIAQMWQRYPMPYITYRQLRARLLTQKTVYGFKLHTNLHSEQVADPVSFLQTVYRRGWKIIHLERVSLFDQVISAMVGARTNRFFGHNRGPEPDVQLTLAADECQALLASATRIRQHHRAILADIPHMGIVYEDSLADDACWQETVTQICGYLDIPAPTHVETHITKPWSRPYGELITNYAELQAMADEYHANSD
ncbi:MAG: sulfotransferase [Caldilineaceae bacterium]